MKVVVWFQGFRVVRVLSLGMLFASFVFTNVRAAVFTAVPVKFTWNASPDPTITGYALYYGLVNSSVTNRVDLGAAQIGTLHNLYSRSNYFFFVVGYNAAGLESLPSNVVNYSPPAVSRLTLSKLTNGSMQVQFRAATGAVCRVQYAAAPNSGQWQTLASATADTNGNIVVTDPPAGRPAIRYYRAVRP